jgi:hypothetical protein
LSRRLLVFVTHPILSFWAACFCAGATAVRRDRPQTFAGHGQQHQIEDRIVAGDKAGRAVFGDREAMSAKPPLDRKADMQIIVDNQDPTHTGPQPSATRWTNACVDRAMAFAAANQRRLQLHRRRDTLSARKSV